MNIYDNISDSNLIILNKICTTFFKNRIPHELIKNSSEITPEKDKIPAQFFADPAHKMFPCHTKNATVLSAIYFWGQKNVPWDITTPKEFVGQRIEKYARQWGVLPQVRTIQNTIKSVTASKPVHALIEKFGSKLIKKFPLGNAEQTNISIKNFIKYCGHYPYQWRKKTASRILKHCRDNNYTISIDALDKLVKMAGMYPVDRNTLLMNISLRALEYPVQDIRTKFAKLLEVKKLNCLEKVCNVIEKADEFCKLIPRYDRDLPLPEELCFKGVKKDIDTSCIKLSTGNVYKTEDICKSAHLYDILHTLPVDHILQFKETKGNTKLAFINLFEKLPHDEAKRLEAVLSTFNIHAEKDENDTTAAH